jgi:hypothetical protein
MLEPTLTVVGPDGMAGSDHQTMAASASHRLHYMILIMISTFTS